MRSPACSRQRNAIFPPLIHQTWPEPFSGALYYVLEHPIKRCTIRGPLSPNSHGYPAEGMNEIMATISKKNGRKIIPMSICVLPLTSSNEPNQDLLSGIIGNYHTDPC